MTAMMVMAAQAVIDRTMTLGDLAMINAYLIQLFIPLNFLGFVYREIRRALTDLENMLGLLSREPQIRNAADAKPLQVTEGRIEFDSVHFGYHAERPILKDLTFAVEPGQRVALVGASGAGKSTIARLLYRFYDLNQGAIRIDGQDIRHVTSSEEHTSALQSRGHLVCRLLLEKKKAGSR